MLHLFWSSLCAGVQFHHPGIVFLSPSRLSWDQKKGISPVFPFSGNGSAQTRLCCFLLEMREFCCCICTPRNSPGNNKPSSHTTAVPMRQPQNLPPHPAATLVWQKSWQGAARHEMIKASTKKPREQRALHPGTSEFHPQDLCNPKEN